MLVPLELLIAATGLASGLVGTYVSLQNRALLAEVRKELAETENRVFARINGSFVRQRECVLREALVRERIDALAGERTKNGDAAGG
jgi:hypothetical protein